MQVLHIFPTTIRRRILRHLYLRHVRNAYLFKGVRQKFLDALLSVARIELFMPQVCAPVLALTGLCPAGHACACLGTGNGVVHMRASCKAPSGFRCIFMPGEQAPAWPTWAITVQ